MNYSGKMHLKYPVDRGFICDRLSVARADLARGEIGNTLSYELSVTFM